MSGGVGVVIPTRNMSALLDRALHSCCIQGPERVVVVDDFSDDDTPAVIERYQLQYPFVHAVRHPQKAADWVSALRPVYESIGTDHIISLGSDDMLLPGLVAAVRRNIMRPVVFSHYSCSDGDRQWYVRHPFDDVEDFTPERMRHRLQREPAVETGIGSSVRTDVMAWLWRLGFDKLGPHSDSIGYASAAAVFGATYVPLVGAHVSFNRNGYGQRAAAEDPQGWANKAADFMHRAGVDAPTIAALLVKRCYGFAF